MAFLNDSVNGNVIHCTNQFDLDILANDFTTDASHWGGYSTSGTDVVGGTANATAQTGVSHGSATMATDGTALKKVWQIAVGKYERIRYKFDIFTDSDHNDGDVTYGILVPASSVVTQLREHTSDTPIPASGSTDELTVYQDISVAVTTNSATIPDGTWVQLNGASKDSLAASHGEGLIRISGVLEAQATAGNLGFYFAQEATRTEPSRIKAGSTFEFMKF